MGVENEMVPPSILHGLQAVAGLRRGKSEARVREPVKPVPDAAPDDPNGSTPMPCGCPAPTAAQLSRGVLPIHPSLPKDSRIIVPQRVERIFGAEIKRWTIETGPGGLDGWEVAVHGLQTTMVDILVRVAFADRRVVSRLLRRARGRRPPTE